MNEQTYKNDKTLHWMKIHKIVLLRTWDNISNESRSIISADIDSLSEITKWFHSFLENETNRLYESETYSYNNPFTFLRER